MTRERKTIDIWVIQTNFGYGWETEISEESRKEGLQRLREYRDNITGGSVRMMKRRIDKAKYANGDY